MKKSPSSPKANPDKHLYTQLANLRRVFDLAVRAVLAEKRALDRFLSSHWRENRCYGSRDRRLFSESIFAFFRYYGWLKLLLTAGEAAALSAGNSQQLSGRTAAGLLAAAWTLENLPPEPAHKLLCREFDLPMIPPVAAADMLDGDQQWRRQRFVDYVRGFTQMDIMPEWQLLQADWSTDFLQAMPDPEAYFRSLAVRPPLWLRTQNAPVESVISELTQAGLSIRRHPVLPTALAVVGGSVNLYTLEAYRCGRVEVQDLASQVIARVCAPRRGERWWDCCAGAGGKTLALAELMERTGKVVAGDIRSYKLEDLKRRARRSNFPNIETRPWDGNKVPPRRSASFDGILIDAPCSCSGVWRRNSDGRWTATAAEVEQINIIQRNILENVLPALRPNGVLVYATCSVFDSENCAMIRQFAADHSAEYVLEPFADPLSGTMTDGTLKICGSQENCDSMFVARLRKKN